MKFLKPNVLFVNIGWASRYDGLTVIQGDHFWVQSHLGRPEEIGEGSAFLASENKAASCGVGYGKVVPSQLVDVVFVAKNPLSKQHEVVGIYFEPWFSYAYKISQNSKRRVWSIGFAELFLEIAGSLRPTINWPIGRSMRRWAKRFDKIKYPELNLMYNNLLSAYQDNSV